MRIEKLLFIVGILGIIGMSDLIAMYPSQHMYSFSGHNQGGCNQQLFDAHASPSFQSPMVYVLNLAGFPYNQQPSTLLLDWQKQNLFNNQHSWKPPIAHRKNEPKNPPSYEKSVSGNLSNPNKKVIENVKKRPNANALCHHYNFPHNQAAINYAVTSKAKIGVYIDALIAKKAKEAKEAKEAKKAPVSLPEQNSLISKAMHGSRYQVQQPSNKGKVSPLSIEKNITNIIWKYEPPVRLSNEGDDKNHYTSSYNGNFIEKQNERQIEPVMGVVVYPAGLVIMEPNLTNTVPLQQEGLTYNEILSVGKSVTGAVVNSQHNGGKKPSDGPSGKKINRNVDCINPNPYQKRRAILRAYKKK